MKPRFANREDHAFTLIELLVVIAVFAILLALVDFGPSKSAKSKAQRVACVSNLREAGAAFRLWEGDHSDQYPMAVSVTNGGAMEWVEAGRAYRLWQTASNQLVSPKVLWCPADATRIAATNFAIGFSDANISYFVNAEASETYPQMIMLGDNNLLINGKPVQPGILHFWTNAAIAWTKDRHGGCGNVGMADGSAQQLTVISLRSTLTFGAVTNHWLIP